MRSPIVLFLLLVTFACSPSKNEPVYNTCTLKAYITNSDTSSAGKSTLEYDINGRLTKINYDQSSMQIEYGDHQLSVIELNSTRKYVFGNDSLVIYSISKPYGGSLDSTIYQFNSEQYLIKEVAFLNGIFNDSTTYGYKNGNLVRWTQYSKTGISNFEDLQYDETLVSKNWLLENFQSLRPHLYFPGLGKPNKNLVKQAKADSWPYSSTTSYLFNASGFVTRISNRLSSGATDAHDLVYDCQ